MADAQVQHPGRSGRLKYASPQDLPSFPSSGLTKDGAAAGAAASLGWANRKQIEPWKPEKSDAASAAAFLAKDHKMGATWQPDSSSAGARAALLATQKQKQQQQQQQQQTNGGAVTRKGSAGATPQASYGSNTAASHAAAAMKRSQSTKVKPTQTQMMPTTSQTSSHPNQASFGSSAATLAFRSSNSVRRPMQTPIQPSPNDGPGSPEGQGQNSLFAAKSVMASQRRPRSISTPNVTKASYPDEGRASFNALNAATLAHRPSVKSRSHIDNAGASPVVSLPRSMFTANPTMGTQTAEQKKDDDLHASAVAMAKSMYSQQQKMADQSRDGQEGGSEPKTSSSVPRPGVNLQDAAYKLAQERLAKLEEEHKTRRYQEYYGSAPQRRNTLQRRFTLKGRLRRRSSSEGEMDDRQQSERIRQEMSIFSNNLSKVDEQKRSHDREAVLAAAQRNVRARMQGMDEWVYTETGQLPPPRKLSEWELKAHEAATANQEQRNEQTNKHKGQLNMGGGMFMNPEDVDAIASKKVQPLLDEINEKAAEERERQEVARLEAEAKKREEEKEKEREREIKELNRKIREQEKDEAKERKQQEKEAERAKKDEEKARKDEEKAAKAEEKRLAKEEKRRSRAAKREAGAGGATTGNDTDSDENEPEPAMSHVHPQPMVDTHAANHQGHPSSPSPDQQRKPSGEEPRSPTKESGSPTNRVKSWFKTHFHRPRGKSNASHTGGEDKDKGFVGGAALSHRTNDSTASLDNRAASMREVALAGKDSSAVSPASAAEAGESSNAAGPRGRGRAGSVSSDSDEMESVAREKTFSTPPARIRDPNHEKNGSPTRDSKFREII